MNRRRLIRASVPLVAMVLGGLDCDETCRVATEAELQSAFESDACAFVEVTDWDRDELIVTMPDSVTVFTISGGNTGGLRAVSVVGKGNVSITEVPSLESAFIESGSSCTLYNLSGLKEADVRLIGKAELEEDEILLESMLIANGVPELQSLALVSEDNISILVVLADIPWETIDISSDGSLSGAVMRVSGRGATADSLLKLGASMSRVTLSQAPEDLVEEYRDWLISVGYLGTLAVMQCDEEEVQCTTVELM